MARRLRDWLAPVLLGLSVVVAALWAERSELGAVQSFLQRLEFIAYDLRLLLSVDPDAPPDPRVVIIDIDDRSLQAEGRWPWPRDRLAELVERLREAGAVVVAFDIMFPEPEANPAEALSQALSASGASQALLHELMRRSAEFDHDRRLAQVLAEGDVVLGYTFRDDSQPAAGALPPPAMPVDPAQELVIRSFPSYTANLPALQQAARHAGFFTIDPDPDGIYRRAPLVLRHDDGLYPSLPLETVRLYQLQEGFSLDTVRLGGISAVEAVTLGLARIPTDERGQVIVPYRGPQGRFPYLSASEVLRGGGDPELLAGNIALIGTTAKGLFDLRATPVQAAYPGVEVHASIIAALLDGEFPYRPKWAEGANFMLILCLGLILAVVLPRLAPLSLVLASLASLALLHAAYYWLWSRHGLILSVATPSLMGLGLAGVNMGYGFLIENRRREFLKRRFGEYVPPQLVEEMSRSHEAFGFDGESREMTVLFADIRGFTTLSEALDAQALKQLLNRFFTPMTRIIFEHRGTIDKYVGDMVMAFWGAPLPDPAHRRHAVEAALAMLEDVARLRERFLAEGLPAIDIGVGLNTGVMNVGDMGSEYRRAYTVIGDAVNLGARLEGLTKFYGVGLAVSENTRAGLEQDFVFRRLDRVRVKGKNEAVEVFEPLCRREEATAELLAELASAERAFELYLARRWDEAAALYRELAAEHPARRLYGLFLERIESLRAEPPPAGWDGSYTRTEK